jgi:polyisoprenoid-binding protein YceI
MSARTWPDYVKNSQWLLLVVALLATRTEAIDRYRLNPGNTQVSFAIQRLGIQWVTARFTDISGELRVDPAGFSTRVDVSVGVASLNCSESRWNERLRSAEWLDAEQYPRMTYHSSSIERFDEHVVAHGELTLHGVTRSIELEVTLLECSAAESCQFAAHGYLKRSEYGLPHGFWTGGDQVDIHISGSFGEASRLVSQ